ncbi:AbrB family transcriptional regulator [Novosphingobium sp. MW5]|nr:AbrB family transcriptional regulator [Novosphingobium sp. MW5]
MLTPRLTSLSPWQRSALTLVLAMVGAVAFILIGLPLPSSSARCSPAFSPRCWACPCAAPDRSASARATPGIVVGAALTPALIATLPSMIGSIALIPVYIALIGLIGVPFFRKVCGYDAATAVFSYARRVAGHDHFRGRGRGQPLHPVADPCHPRADHRHAGPDPDHAGLWRVDVPPGRRTCPRSAGRRDADHGRRLADRLKGGEKIGLFGASILGPLIVTGALSLAGFIHHRPPAEAIYVAQFFIGSAIGVGYTGVTLHVEIKRDAAAGVGFVLILALLAAIMSEIVYALGLAPSVEAFLAFAPGGQAEMTVLAIVAGADLGYVVVHHILRILLGDHRAPIAARLMRIRQKDAP